MPEGKKRKMGDDERKERNTEYDRTKRHRKYDAKLETTCPWLYLNGTHDMMMCRPCRRFPMLSDRECAFVKGTPNFKVNYIHNIKWKTITIY